MYAAGLSWPFISTQTLYFYCKLLRVQLDKYCDARWPNPDWGSYACLVWSGLVSSSARRVTAARHQATTFICAFHMSGNLFEMSSSWSSSEFQFRTRDRETRQAGKAVQLWFVTLRPLIRHITLQCSCRVKILYNLYIAWIPRTAVWSQAINHNCTHRTVYWTIRWCLAGWPIRV